MLLRYKMAYKNYNLLNIFNKYILFVLNNLKHVYNIFVRVILKFKK